MARKNGITEIDVSGGGFIDDRGRHVNTDVPEGARRSGSAGKSNAKKRLKQKQNKADQRKREIEEEDQEAKTPTKKKKRKKSDDRMSLDPEQEKAKRRKSKADKAKAEEKEKDKDTKKKKKRKKKTVGELLSEGKTEQARKKMNKLASKAMVVSNVDDTNLPELEGGLMPPTISSEAEFLQEYFHIYGTLGSIIRNLEQKMTKPDSEVNSKDVYALMTMYSQMRETIADLRSIKDMNEQAEDLAQHVFDPAAKSAGEALVNLYFKISSSVRQKVDDPSKVEEILETLKLDVGEQASKLQDQFAVARGRIVDILNGGG